MSLGENISNYRKQRKLTQEELGKIIGVATGSLQNYELNKRKPNYEILNKISKALEISIDELVNGESSIYINRLNKLGANIKQSDLSQIPTDQLIQELNNRDDFPITLEIKK